MTGVLSKFMKQSGNRRRLLVEALFRLMWARFLLLVVPFRQLTATFNRQSAPVVPPTASERQSLCQNVCWAIERAALLVPGSTCFPRAIAAQKMCRSRGIDAVLYYGAASLPGRGLSAHVWVKDEHEGVVGHQIANHYIVLARFPS